MLDVAAHNRFEDVAPLMSFSAPASTWIALGGSAVALTQTLGAQAAKLRGMEGRLPMSRSRLALGALLHLALFVACSSSSTEDTSEALAGSSARLWIAFDPGVSSCASHTESFFHCAFESLNFNSLVATYGTSAHPLSFGGAAALSSHCSYVYSVSQASVAADASTLACIRNQTKWAVGNNDTVLFYPQGTGCEAGRNHRPIPANVNGQTVYVRMAFVYAGSSCGCQTALGSHEVYEATTDSDSADCCNGQDGCKATPGPYGWYTLQACSNTYTAQALSPAQHKYDASYCAELKPGGGTTSSDPCAHAQYGGSYCGQSTQYGFAGGTADSLYTCSNGSTTSKVACPAGCEVMPPGQNDQCRPDPCANTQSGGAYCGQSTQFGFSNGVPNVLYECQNQVTTQRTTCSNGCAVMPPGQQDHCL